MNTKKILLLGTTTVLTGMSVLGLTQQVIATLGKTSGGTPLFGYWCNNVTNSEEKQVLDKVNQFRNSNKKSWLACDSIASEVARNYSQTMCNYRLAQNSNKINIQQQHSLNGKNPIERLRNAGHTRLTENVRENIYWGSGSSLANSPVEWWEKSSGHKANMLDNGVTQMGVGSFNCKRDNYTYWTLILLEGNPPLIGKDTILLP
jgi:uncharacterized protein YkwD